MHTFEYTVALIDEVLNTKRKRHIIGGTLLSAALFFGGLAFTILSVKE